MSLHKLEKYKSKIEKCIKNKNYSKINNYIDHFQYHNRNSTMIGGSISDDLDKKIKELEDELRLLNNKYIVFEKIKYNNTKMI